MNQINKMNQMKKKYLQILNHKHFYKFFLALICIVIIASQQSNKTKESSDSKRVESMDTHIPSGYVLVPIDVQNYEALDRILGQFGVVDLYQSQIEGRKRGRLVAEKIKILRSPKDPNYFAVLAPDSKARYIVQNPGPFTVVIQNPKEYGTQIVHRKPKRRIFIEEK